MMTETTEPVNLTPVNFSIAPLVNVQLLSGLVERVLNRSPGLPGMACFYGPSGFGKTSAAIYAANKYRAYHVQCDTTWTGKKLCSAILTDMGITQKSTIYDMVDQIGEQLSLSSRPLLVDEADCLIAKGMIEVVRALYERSQGTVILIGEEKLPSKLVAWERIHGRMLDWVAAQPVSLADAGHLAGAYGRGVKLSADLVAALHEASNGSARRVIVNIDRVREAAETQSLKTIDLAGWKSLGRDFFTGRPPAARSFR